MNIRLLLSYTFLLRPGTCCSPLGKCLAHIRLLGVVQGGRKRGGGKEEQMEEQERGGGQGPFRTESECITHSVEGSELTETRSLTPAKHTNQSQTSAAPTYYQVQVCVSRCPCLHPVGRHLLCVLVEVVTTAGKDAFLSLILGGGEGGGRVCVGRGGGKRDGRIRTGT